MEAGIVAQDQLNTFMRLAAQRKQTGILEISYPERQVQLLFSSGKIVDVVVLVDGAAVNPAKEVLARLQQANVISLSSDKFEELSQGDYVALYQYLCDQNSSITEDRFREIVSHRVLDRFYELDLSVSGQYHFHSQAIEYEGVYSPELSVSKLLLDLVALEADGVRFSAAFPTGVRVARSEHVASHPQDEEKILLDLLQDKRTIEELRDQSLLSRFVFEDTLLSMLERGWIVIEKTTIEQVFGQQVKESAEQASQLLREVRHISDLLPQGSTIGGGKPQVKIYSEEQSAPRKESINERLLKSTVPMNIGALLLVGLALALPFWFWVEPIAFFTAR